MGKPNLDRHPQLEATIKRREFIRTAVAGTAFLGFGGAVVHLAAHDLTREARAELRPDGRPRLPPGQRVLEMLRPMGGDEGDGKTETFSLKVHGLCKRPFAIDYVNLLKLTQVERTADVHCVTGWSMLGGKWKGVQVAHLATLAEVKPEARYVIFEAAHGYTCNVPLRYALADNAMLTYRLNGKPLARAHGAPVRGLVPDLYFWKSAKWITGIRFVVDDQPGYWERRGYHNLGDPWKQQRYG